MQESCRVKGVNVVLNIPRPIALIYRNTCLVVRFQMFSYVTFFVKDTFRMPRL